MTKPQSSGAGAPAVLAMSGVNRNAIVTNLSRSGWRVVGSRGFADARARLLDAGASCAVIDLRDDAIAALGAIRTLASQANILAIVPGRDLKWITAAIDAGATHYLTSPFAPLELSQAVRLIAGPRLGPATGMPSADAAVAEGSGATAAIAQRLTEGRVSALLIAATRFENVNAAFGRDVGDELLGAVAQRISGTVRAVDPDATTARVSGAEFAVMVASGRGAALAQEIVSRIDRPFMVGGHIVTIGCRIGVVESAVGEDAVALLRRASAALAQARLSDGSPVHAIGAESVDERLFNATLEGDLRRAVAADQIDVVYQPQVDIASGRIVGVEALARWKHPEHGDLGATTLFAVAARSDYLATLSQHIQRRALHEAAAWPAALSALRVAINLNAGDIAAPGAAANFLALVAGSTFPRDRLTVEITESGLINDIQSAAAVFAALRAAGVRVAIDDFGTGYSSLAWLKALPLDYLKIDRGLTQDIAGSTRDRIVVRGVIDIARSLGLSVIAEGVETDEQLALLAADGCNYYQGFLFAEALSSAALAARVSAHD